MTFASTDLRLGTPNPLVAYSHSQAFTSPTICPTPPLWCRLSKSPLLESALYTAEKSYGWNTADSEVSGQPPLVPFGMIAEFSAV